MIDDLSSLSSTGDFSKRPVYLVCLDWENCRNRSGTGTGRSTVGTYMYSYMYIDLHVLYMYVRYR